MLYQLSFFFNYKNMIKSFTKFSNALGLKRPRHSNLIEANPQINCGMFIDV